MTLANKLTVGRMAALPAIWAFACAPFPHAKVWAALLFTAAAVTDIIDGHIARTTHTVSNFGKVFDPIADKLLLLTALLPLLAQDKVPAWMAMVLIAREMMVSGLRVVLVAQGGEVLAAKWLGKLKTVLQDVAMVLLLLQGELLWISTLYLDRIALWLALLFTVVSLVDYFYHARCYFSKNRGQL